MQMTKVLKETQVTPKEIYAAVKPAVTRNKKKYTKSETLDRVYLNIAGEISQLSKCNRKKVGAIIVKNDNILSFGYNGTPMGLCNDCEKDGVTKWQVLHAESNAISKVAKTTQSSQGSTLYCTLSPCDECSKLIIQAGITRVVYLEVYDKTTKGIDLMISSGINVEKYSEHTTLNKTHTLT